MKNKTLCIIGCSKSKNTGTMRAKHIYDKSFLFRISKEFCSKNNFDFIIISAKYGVLQPDDIIDDYDQTLNYKHEVIQLSNIVVPKLKEIIKDYDKIIIFCGKKYVETFKVLINDKFSFPLKNLSFGERIQWLKNKVESGEEK